MSKSYKTFTKEKWLYFALAIITFFTPTIIVIACVFPFMRNADAGYKVGLGLVVFIINCIPFLVGIFKWFFSHFPFFNWFAGAFLILGLLFKFDIIAEYMDKFLWIEGVAFICGLISSVFWGLHRKYKAYHTTVKANIKSGMYKVKDESEE